MSEPQYRYDGSGMQLGDDLFTLTDVGDWMVGYVDFRKHTGISDENLLSDALVATALPIYPADPATPPDWRAEVLPDSLWHPLMWLPGDLRPVVVDGELEPAKVWALRVALEMQYSGLYHPERGWLDITTTNGLDPSWPHHRATPGAQDELEEWTVADYLVGEDREWAHQMAADLLVPAQSRTWALIAVQVGQHAALCRENSDLEEARPLPLLATPLLEATDDAEMVWQRITDQLDQGDLRCLDTAIAWCEGIRDIHWDGVQIIHDTFGQEQPA